MTDEDCCEDCCDLNKNISMDFPKISKTKQISLWKFSLPLLLGTFGVDEFLSVLLTSDIFVLSVVLWNAFGKPHCVSVVAVPLAIIISPLEHLETEYVQCKT